MSIADELTALETNLDNAKDAVVAKGGTVGDTGLAGLATEIANIPSGGGGGGSTDPAVVYATKRPADWLPMPTPANNEIYLLVEVPKPNQEKDPGTPLAFLCQTSAGQYRVELGTVTNGEFVADSTYTTLVNSNTKYTKRLYYANWATNPMTDGTHQVMVKISTVSGNITSFDHVQYIQNGLWGNKYTLEARGHCESVSKYNFSYFSTGRAALSMRFCSLEGTNNITNFSYMFYSCSSLTAILALDTSSCTNFQSMFQSCSALTAIPQLDTSKGTNFASMFQSCRALTTIPALDTSKGTSFISMFQSCFSLATIPQLNTSSGTNFNSMFYECYSLTAIPQLNTSLGTNFSYMFSSCSSLTTIPQLDTSSGTDFGNMFYTCSSLANIPQLNTSKGTSFVGMFAYSPSLTNIPQLSTSRGVSFNSMFSGCYSLTTIPQLNTSSSTNFQSMLQDCSSLTYIDFVGYDFTGVTNANNRPTSIYTNGGGIMRIDNKFQMSTGGFTGAVIATPQGASASNPFYILIEDETAMIPLGANATTVFTTSSYVHVVVPDSMYNTYAADTYWATLGTRLKKRSEVTLPSWYTD